jgi:hypothetical protein
MYKLIPLDVEPKSDFPIIASGLRKKNDGSFFLTLLFAKENLYKLTLKKNDLVAIENQKVEELFEDDFVGIVGGLRGTRTGDTAFATLHKASKGVLGFLKKAKAFDSEEDFYFDLAEDGGSYGFSYKHSIVQIVDGEYKIRRHKEPGALLDAAHIGDYIFGLSGSTLFREMYLNTEKRYFLREDLEVNFRIHKVEGGVFWLAGSEGKMMKAGLTDKNALPTTKKIPGLPFKFSVYCEVDGWLYGIGAKTLFRVRVNPESRVDELQVLIQFEDVNPLSIAVREMPSNKPEDLKKATIYLSADSAQGSVLYSFEVAELEDKEELPPLPELKEVWKSNDLNRLQNLSLSDEGTLVGTCFTANAKLALFVQSF